MTDRFIVSARKYRPATFDTVVGQEAVTSTLKNAIRNDHLAQAFLFTGPRGVGKTTCARILARTINCEHLGEDLVACGQCAPCRTFEEGHSLNIFELDAASNNSVEDIRNLILQVSIAPQVGSKKVYIIDEVHMLSSAAFNAFLKTLEEPPSYAIFILATTEKHKILPTILSRCQVFDFRRIGLKDISDHLAGIAAKEGIEAEPQALHTIAQKADGGLRDALSIFDQLVSFAGHRLTYQDVVKNLNVLDHEHYFSLTDRFLQADTAGSLLEFNEILQQGFDGHLFVAGLGHHFRDLLVGQDPRTAGLLEVSEDLVPRYADQAGRMPREALMKGLDLIATCDGQYKGAREPRLLVELLLLRLCSLASSPNGTAAAEEKKSPDVPIAAPRPAPGPVGTAPTAPPATAAAAAPAPEPTPARPAEALPAPRRRLAGQVSIKALTEQAEELARPEQPLRPALPLSQAAPPGPASDPDKPIPATLLQKIWQDHALEHKHAGRNSLHATLTAKLPEVVGHRSVTFTIVNEVQEKYMREEKPQLLGRLRRELDMPDLELEVVKQEVTDLRPRYTPRDRFNILAEKNPALLKLRDELDLDLS